jgi:Ca2+/H+ antiporter, TMEM165/GDT1 family
MKWLTFTLLMLLCVNNFYSMRLEKLDTLNRPSNDLNKQGILAKVHILNTEIENKYALFINANSSSTKIKEGFNLSNVYEILSDTSTFFLAGICDRSFLITAIMAQNYSKLIVFISAISSFIIIEYISVQIGLSVPDYIPTYLVDILAVLVFLYIGMKMLIDGLKISHKMNCEKMTALHDEINKEIFRENEILAQINQQENLEEIKSSNFKEILEVFVQIFILLFLSELGEKSQLSTIYVSKNFNQLVIFSSVMFAQILLTSVAVLVSLYLSRIFSEKTLNITAGIMTIALGVIYLYLTYINDFVIINRTWHNLVESYQINPHLQKIPEREVIKNSFLQI